MTAPDDRRDDLTNRMADFVLVHGLEAATLSPLAAAAGVSDRMLLYYFKDKPAVMAAVLECLSQRLTAQLTARTSPQRLSAGQLRRHVFQQTAGDDLWPYMQVWMEVAVRAAREDKLCFAVGHKMGQAVLAWISSQLDGGNMGQAARLLTLVEGRLMLKSIGMRDLDMGEA